MFPRYPESRQRYHRTLPIPLFTECDPTVKPRPWSLLGRLPAGVPRGGKAFNVCQHSRNLALLPQVPLVAPSPFLVLHCFVESDSRRRDDERHRERNPHQTPSTSVGGQHPSRVLNGGQEPILQDTPTFYEPISIMTRGTLTQKATASAAIAGGRGQKSFPLWHVEQTSPTWDLSAL